MKNTILIILALLIGLGVGYVIFGGKDTISVSDAQTTVKQLYTCGMHPEIISEEPGYCPICGMKLVPKKDGGESSEIGIISIDPTTVQNMGLRTAPVQTGILSKTIRAYGQMDFDETRQYAINMKISGWIEKLYVDFEGAKVKTGDRLLDIYSPELVAAQKEYLVAYKNSKNVTSIQSVSEQSNRLLTASEQRLANWDISQDQIQRLRSDGEVFKVLTMRAPATGVVVKKYAFEGAYLKAGANLFEVADLSTLWLRAFVYEHEIPFLRLGQEVLVELPYLPGESFSGTISFISPELDAKRQAEVRINVPNPSGQLKPGMYSEVLIASHLHEKKKLIPASAVINSGLRQLVFVDIGEGKFEPRQVEVGHYGDNDMLEIVSGLEPGEIIVTSGQFLLDSETRLNEALAFGHAHGSHEPKTEPAGEEQSPGTTHQHESTDVKHEKKVEENIPSGIYTCPMDEHSHIVQYGPGKCPLCGMRLVPIEETSGRTVYLCPMTEDSVVSAKPGKCPKCGMKLVKMEQKPELTLYVCPMPEDSVVSFEPGKCPKCGMKLVQAKDVGDMTLYVCPMPEDSVVSFKPGNCPKCGMKLIKMEKKPELTLYVCPMPKDSVISFEPGKCPKCGMKLVHAEKAGELTVYVCPMPEDSVVSFNPRECPKCGMKLEAVKIGGKKK
ncbi:MAG: efflux RND transporter periplasmic adaptor subunit [Candidatus Zixiibacteriota bacterium]